MQNSLLLLLPSSTQGLSSCLSHGCAEDPLPVPGRSRGPRWAELSQCSPCVLWLSVLCVSVSRALLLPTLFTSQHFFLPVSGSGRGNAAVPGSPPGLHPALTLLPQGLHGLLRQDPALSEPPPVMCFTFPKQMSVQCFTESVFAQGCQHQTKTRQKSLALDFDLIPMLVSGVCFELQLGHSSSELLLSFVYLELQEFK